MISKKAKYILHHIAVKTHPDEAFRQWTEEPEKNISAEITELKNAGLIREVEGSYQLTRLGLSAIKERNDEALIQKITSLVPRVPSFENIAQNLSDTAVMRAIYVLLGEIGKRGNPDNHEDYKYWTSKVQDLESLLTDADPTTLWERFNNMKM